MIPVDQWSEVVNNVVEFNKNLDYSLSVARQRFAHFSHWYYIPQIKMFGPSKFVGYKDTTHRNYIGNGSGGITQYALKKFFLPITFGTTEYNDLLAMLLDFAEQNGCRISHKTRTGKDGGIYLPRQWYLAQ